MVAVFVSEDNKDSTLEKIVNPLAKEMKGEVTFTWSTQGQLADRWGATGKVLPTAIFVKFGAGSSDVSFDVWDEGTPVEFNEANVRDFVKQAVAGTYKGFIKSEPIPETQGPVTVLVGKTIESVIDDATKDVLVEFYAPWCGHCKKLEPIYNELGEKFAGSEGLVLAKIDSTANTIPSKISVQGFPTIIWFPKAGEPETYNGGRDLEDFVTFLAGKGYQPTVATPTEVVGETKEEPAVVVEKEDL
jgi:protein disulfide isomerase